MTTSLPPTANYDFEFALFDALSGGTQIGSTLSRNGVAVTGGIFAVNLDFGGQFPGADRFLEIRVRPTGGGSFTPLTPRQPVSSAPYSVRSLNATAADTALNAANATNATTATNATQLGGIAAGQYVLTGDARLSDARNPLPNSGNYIQNTTSPQTSSNFKIWGNGIAGGTLWGNAVNSETYFYTGGIRVLSTDGTNNVFVGHASGVLNTGTGNSFLGQDAGNVNAAGSFNTFVGRWAGFSNTSADSNTFVGFGAGKLTTTAGSNAFFGANAGNANTTGSSNTILGANADVSSGSLTFATAIGAGAVALHGSEITLGRPNGQDSVNVPGYASFGGILTGTLGLVTLAAAGSTNLCLNSNNGVGTCSSSLRYKANLAPYSNGLNILNRLRPITFDWKEGGMHDLGLGAEDVEKIDPLLVTYNAQGQVEGVKYDRIGVVLVNAVKEQQQIIENQQKQIDALKAILCRSNPDETICR